MDAQAIDLGDPISLLAPVHPQRGKDVLGHRLALTTNALLYVPTPRDAARLL